MVKSSMGKMFCSAKAEPVPSMYYGIFASLNGSRWVLLVNRGIKL